jgi:hypothetical protein
VIRGLASALPLVAAAGLWLGVAVPARQQRDLARSEYARARELRERLHAQTLALRHEDEAGRTPQAGAAAGQALRSSLLRAIRGLTVGEVQIAAGASGGPVAARGHLSAVGRMQDLLVATQRLAAPDSGVLVERVALTGRRGPQRSVRLDVEVFNRRPDQ